MKHTPSSHALQAIGEECEYEGGKPGKIRKVKGVVTDVEASGSAIERKDGSRFHGIRYKIKPENGSRAFWTEVMPDAWYDEDGKLFGDISKEKASFAV